MGRPPDAEMNLALPPRSILLNGMHPPARGEATRRWASRQNTYSDGSVAPHYFVPLEGQQIGLDARKPSTSSHGRPPISMRLPHTMMQLDSAKRQQPFTANLREWQTQAETERRRRSPLPRAAPLVRFLLPPPPRSPSSDAAATDTRGVPSQRVNVSNAIPTAPIRAGEQYALPDTFSRPLIPLPRGPPPLRLRKRPLKAPLQARPHDRRSTMIENDSPLQTRLHGLGLRLFDDSDDSDDSDIENEPLLQTRPHDHWPPMIEDSDTKTTSLLLTL